jgi:BirA family biotin operon repressor/biotin-[acetyl-CoA-carboxylase] ligase
VVAEEQTAGRGRLGRTWHSEKSSGIYVSIILRPPLAPSAAPALTLMAGVAVHEAIRIAAGVTRIFAAERRGGREKSLRNPPK